MQADMQADFLDAHERHWEDAERLYQAQRWANADHLYGMAAECGLKRLMSAFGMRLNSSGSPSGDDRKHVDTIWERYETYRSGNVAGAEYGLPAENPFKNWKVSDRYANQVNFSQTRAGEQQAGAQTVREMVAKANREGLLT